VRASLPGQGGIERQKSARRNCFPPKDRRTRSSGRS
jgi:hypothetical protein